MKHSFLVAVICALALWLVPGTAQAGSCKIPGGNGSAKCGGTLELAPGQRIRFHLSASKGNFEIEIKVKILEDKSKPPSSKDGYFWKKNIDPGDIVLSPANDLSYPITVYVEVEAEDLLEEIVGGTIIYEVSKE